MHQLFPLGRVPPQLRSPSVRCPADTEHASVTKRRMGRPEAGGRGQTQPQSLKPERVTILKARYGMG